MKRRRDEIEIIAAILECIINNKNHKLRSQKSYMAIIYITLSLLIIFTSYRKRIDIVSKVRSHLYNDS